MADVLEIQRTALGIAIADVHWKTKEGEHVGVYETARNHSIQIRRMLEMAGIFTPAAWCAAAGYSWCSEACELLDVPNPLLAVEQKALVQSYVDWAVENDALIGRGDREPGDIVCFNFRGIRYDHMGLLFSVEPLQCVEGNTFKDDGDDDVPGDRGEREGYEVEVKYRKIEYEEPTLFIRWARAA